LIIPAIMKKVLIFTLVIFCRGYYINAQVNPNAIGLRFGGNGNVNGVELWGLALGVRYTW